MNAALRIVPTPRPGIRLLVVHPQARERDRIAELLGEDGFSVDTATSGVDAALRLSDADRPRLVVAYAFAEEAVEIVTAARGFAPPVRIVLVLPKHDERAERRAKQLGVSAIFTGPVDLDDLRTAVMNLAPRRAIHASGVYGVGEE
jgi:DNA-binding response OmpR family regulator